VLINSTGLALEQNVKHVRQNVQSALIKQPIAQTVKQIQQFRVMIVFVTLALQMQATVLALHV